MVVSNDELNENRQRPLDSYLSSTSMSPFDVSQNYPEMRCTARGSSGIRCSAPTNVFPSNDLNEPRHASSGMDSVLIEAVKGNDDRRCESLLRNGHNANVDDELNRSALFWAALKGNRRISELLILSGARVDRRSVNGSTALHGAAQRGSIDVTDLLVKRGLDINQQSEEGDTALHIAAYFGHLPLVRFLLPHADVTIANRRGLTAVDEAEQQGHREIVELFRKLRVHLPLSRTRSIVPTNVTMHSETTKQLNVVQPDLLRVVHEDLQRSKSAPLVADGWNIPPRIENARSQEHLPRWGAAASVRGQNLPSAHECCPCAQNLRQENRELRTMYEDLQLELTLAKDRIDNQRIDDTMKHV